MCLWTKHERDATQNPSLSPSLCAPPRQRYEPYNKQTQFNRFVKGQGRQESRGAHTFNPRLVQTILRPIMLRRTKATLIDGRPIIQLPDKVQHHFRLRFTPQEQRTYADLSYAARRQAARLESQGTFARRLMELLVVLLRLRQACNSVVLSRTDLEAHQAGPEEVRVGGGWLALFFYFEAMFWRDEWCARA